MASSLIRPPPLPGQPSSGAKSRYAGSLLSPDELDRFKNLLLFAQTTVDGFFAGRHRSPHPGSSAEFRDYKDYVAGDSLDRIDWRAYGRTRRLFVRRYEDETDMVAYLLVDTSGSMRFSGEARAPKFHHAARIAAALAYLMTKQGDKAALGLFADTLKTWLPPGGTRRHLHEMTTALERVQPDRATDLPAALRQAAEACRKRGRLVVLSDFFADPVVLFDALAQFQHRGFKILLLQVLDPDEIELPAHRVARYVDLETAEEIEVDAEDLRALYRQNIRVAIDTLAREASARGIEYQQVNTGEAYTRVLEAYLGFRGPVR
ncbi:MAG: hypothetical protein K0R17_915 [Rariglobus sp.]|jgi:uncharacterized protein (DUF58 family)|nr:hypothetical protein [Rariglobus sp.]